MVINMELSDEWKLALKIYEHELQGKYLSIDELTIKELSMVQNIIDWGLVKRKYMNTNGCLRGYLVTNITSRPLIEEMYKKFIKKD